MPTFETPEPISAVIDLPLGEVNIVASDRSDTAVEVRPTDANSADDVRLAEQTRIDFSNGNLVVKAPRTWRDYLPMRTSGSIDVTVELPEGSQLRGDAGAGTFRSQGRLGACKFKTGAGDLRLASTGALDVATGLGTVNVEEVHGSAQVTTGSGEVHLGSVDGDVSVKNANGDVYIGAATGVVKCRAANGKIAVERAESDLTAKSANGAIRVGQLTRGSASLGTALGDIEIGLRAGTAARLDVDTKFGRLRNELDAAAAPEPTDERVEVRARTAAGDVIVRRA
ncbi:DUF4097 family beta strand repeat-containing protein [Aldersonia kunmingensis]|uniref:DUF4097 family beta strand repeat-containing protein n=1 Tax=Aldersonia kunmingensis TaxID=408066 RepID=UPI000833DF03|nr:DUF4097 family beta strand repeat-containing protein [Aldersonia kunmingensis]